MTFEYSVRVKAEIPIIYGLVNKIREDGYEAGDFEGTIISKPRQFDDTRVSLIIPTRSQKRIFGIPIEPKPRGVYLGNIENIDKTKWVFRVNGRQYIPRVEEYASHLAEHFDVRCRVILNSESPKIETKKSDWVFL